MREIKFRCWGEESKKWFYYNEIDGRSLITPDQKCSQSFEYTGLKDKNGKEIYEGDIVKGSYLSCGPREIGVITYKDRGHECLVGCFGVEHHIVDGYAESDMNDFSELEMQQYNEDGKLNHLEIIGNIYENPELIDKLTEII